MAKKNAVKGVPVITPSRVPSKSSPKKAPGFPSTRSRGPKDRVLGMIASFSALADGYKLGKPNTEHYERGFIAGMQAVHEAQRRREAQRKLEAALGIGAAAKPVRSAAKDGTRAKPGRKATPTTKKSPSR